ncbi:hypothetical protein GsuE55_29110 [Geobacillus subterraneus]|uniref:Uncharacterized protein n=1 Tax=Geobacillus subterraneus TaxID=129338 RepID=A0A679FNN7_9BACL|nr:hypothetical protein GsuE55_29110 [Geobacillus subterraneus]
MISMNPVVMMMSGHDRIESEKGEKSDDDAVGTVSEAAAGRGENAAKRA